MHVRVHLKNWRSVDEATVDLAPFTVVVGRNSTGKSNFVDALRFASEVGRDATTAVSQRGGIESIRRWGPSRPYDVTVEWRVASSRAALDHEYTRHLMVLRSGKSGAWHFHHEEIEAVGKERLIVERKRSTMKATRGSVPVRRMEEDIPETTSAMLFARLSGIAMTAGARALATVRALRPVPELMRRPQPPSNSPRLVENGENVATALQSLDEEQKGAVLAAMQRIVPGLMDVTASSAGRYLTLVFRQSQTPERTPDFAATEMSDGALRALAVVIAAQQMRRNELLVIEEPEVNLHPGAARVIYDVLHRAASRGAVLVTTHSPELLDHARDDEILVCEYVDGVTRIGPLAEAQRKLVRDGLFSVSEIMRSEELRREGASPRAVAD